MLSDNCVMVSGCFGYIGNALTQRLLLEGYKVIGIDNNFRSKMVREQNSHSATKQPLPSEREELFRDLGNFILYDFDVSESYLPLKSIIGYYKPFTIVNLAHQPSGPYSQKDVYHADYSLMNNIRGTNNFLWAIKEINPNIHYTTIGSTGTYQHDINVPIEEGYFSFESNGRNSSESIFPRRPNSIYHCSKTATLYIADYLTRLWGLKASDASQSVVFGIYTKETDETGILSRLDVDGCFGTVLNKFIVQSLLEIPLTIFGEGEHQRGFLALQNSVDAIMLSIKNPPENGKLRTFNQLSETWSMNELAEKVKETAKKIKNIDINFNYIKPSPRKEYTGDHYYKYVSEILPSMGYRPSRSIEQEIEYIFKMLDVDYIQNLKNTITKNINF